MNIHIPLSERQAVFVRLALIEYKDRESFFSNAKIVHDEKADEWALTGSVNAPTIDMESKVLVALILAAWEHGDNSNAF